MTPLQARDPVSLERPQPVGSLEMHFPSNAISLIIDYSCPLQFVNTYREDWGLEVESKFHLTLAAVSSLWRKAVISKPQLWSTVVFRNVSRADAQKRGNFLQLCLERSAGNWFDISISFIGGEWDYSTDLLSPEADKSILKYMDWIVNLRLISPPYKWVAMIPTMSSLKTLVLYSSFDDVLSLPKDEQLGQLYLRAPCCEIRFWAPDYTLSILDLVNTPIDLCMNLLRGCPYLIEFYCSDPAEPVGDFGYHMLKRPYILHRLQHLEWQLLDETLVEWNDNFLECIRLPSLVSLTWVETVESAWGPKTHLFSHHLPLTFAILEFIGVVQQNPIFENMNYNTEVEAVVMKSCGGDLVEALLSKMLFEEDSDEEGAFAFPHLESVFINGCRTRDNKRLVALPAELGEILVEALKARFDDIVGFDLKMECVGLQEWTSSVKDGLRKLEKDGLDLVLIDHGTPVNWLDFKFRTFLDA